jgi:hypothetical protein
MTASADMAGEKVREARTRLAAALESGKDIYGRVHAKAVDCAKVTDEAVHGHPHQKPSASPWVWGRSLAISSCADTPATTGKRAKEPSPTKAEQ